MSNQTPILITGCPRSGTSMVAGLIYLGHVFAGQVDRMYENIPVREVFVKNYLRSVGMDPNGCCPLVSKYPMLLPEYWNEKIVESFRTQGAEDAQWFYKDSRTALLWQLWSLAFPNAKWIIVRRRREDIIESCQKTGYMRTFHEESTKVHLGIESATEGWNWVVSEYETRFHKIQRNNPENVREVWPEKMADGDYSEMQEVFDWLGLSWNQQQVEEYIQPKLYRHINKKNVL